MCGGILAHLPVRLAGAIKFVFVLPVRLAWVVKCFLLFMPAWFAWMEEFLSYLPIGLACVPGFEFFCLRGKICTGFGCEVNLYVCGELLFFSFFYFLRGLFAWLNFSC